MGVWLFFGSPVGGGGGQGPAPQAVGEWRLVPGAHADKELCGFEGNWAVLEYRPTTSGRVGQDLAVQPGDRWEFEDAWEAAYVMWALLFPQDELPLQGADRTPETLHHLADKAARDFHPLLQRLVETADVDYTMAVQLGAARKPTAWPVSRATLIGDAVHVMPPFGAHGGNTALRDAALLAQYLEEQASTEEALEKAVGAFQSEMVEYAFREVEESKSVMRRFNIDNRLARWMMMQAIPWFRSLTNVPLTKQIDV
jgi:2-polyprenyl-6-methoxyphenol hydroxylase-like FAD-dependent oxidoreductase